MNSLQNLPTLRVSSVSKTYQLYAYLQLPKPANFTCTSRLQHLSILRTSSVSNIQNPCPGFHSSDSLMLAPLAKMRSSIYAGFREGPPTLVNIAGVNAYCKTPYLPYGKKRKLSLSSFKNDLFILHLCGNCLFWWFPS